MSFLIPANETQLEYIKTENNHRTNSELEEDVTKLIEWLSKQPHLPNVTDRKWLLHFIKGCKFSLQRSKEIIELYFIARSEIPELFDCVTQDDFDKGATFGRQSFLPKLTPEGYRVNCIRTFPTKDGEVFVPTPIIKWLLTILQLQLKEEPMYGNIYLFDLKYFQLSHFLTFSPTLFKNLFKCCIHSFPLRLKSIHYLNPPFFIGRLLVLVKMFLPNKLKQRLFVHNSLEELYLHIPKDVLPEIYGGTAGNIEQLEDYTIELFKSNIEWLEAQPKADLSKLPKSLVSDELNMSGTFKQIQID